MQLQAGYILSLHRRELYEFARQKDKAKEPAVNGLLKELSTFEVTTDLKMELPAELPAVCAVALNLITRGLPTFSSMLVEQEIGKATGLFSLDTQDESGKVVFKWSNNLVKTGEKIFQALHAVAPVSVPREQYLNQDLLGSDFEKSFIFEYIPKDLEFLVQMFEMQRSRESIRRSRIEGRIDFSIESPYNHTRERTNKFGNKVSTKHHNLYIVEVDGARYHTDFIDNLKDYEIAEFPRNIFHITEAQVFNDVQTFLDAVLADDYISRCKRNFENQDYLYDPFVATCLIPFSIARIQSVLLRYFIANAQNFGDQRPFRVAIVEDDLPCGHLAVKDLERTLSNLYELAEFASGPKFPEIHYDVFCHPEMLGHPLHLSESISVKSFSDEGYDLVIDVSILKRARTFVETFNAKNIVRIRNSHYTHYKTETPVFCASGIKYKPFIDVLSNERYEEIPEVSVRLKTILRDVFRNMEFKDGQLPILNRALSLQSVIGLLPTGGGKSLTYQLAALLQPGVTVVVDPIKSLMVDQFLELREIGIDKCEFVNSTLSSAEKRYNQKVLLKNGLLHFIFVSPERFVIEEFRLTLKEALADRHWFSYVVIDEVHCVSEWGHDFRVPYLNLGENAQELCKTADGYPVPLFGLTATASFDVLTDVERELKIKRDDGSAVVRFENTLREEINYQIVPINTQFPNINNEFLIRNEIGISKQAKLFEIIGNAPSYVLQFNDDEALTDILQISFNNYLPLDVRALWIAAYETEEMALEAYVREGISRLRLNVEHFTFVEDEDGRKYYYGIIVFMPHRTGSLGIKNGNETKGAFENDNFVEIRSEKNRNVHYFRNETLGFFMGSSDGQDNDSESFYHLEHFKENRESLMIATIAFGMGINKKNVRMTVHFNLPQSIESYVQEAGRSGRDHCLSTSLILFDGQNINGNIMDKDVLMYFHNNAFRGRMKERVMVYELRNRIMHPNITRLGQLTVQINDLWRNPQFQYALKLGKNAHNNRLFINTDDGTSIGFVFLDTLETGLRIEFSNADWSHQLVDYISNIFPPNLASLEDRTHWLNETLVDELTEQGIEQALNSMLIGDVHQTIYVPFTNKYLSKKSSFFGHFNLNHHHLSLMMGCSTVVYLIQNRYVMEDTFRFKFKKAIYENMDYEKFIDSLEINNSDFVLQLKDEFNPSSLSIQRAYCAPRSQEDTAKAIYRLISIGVIDTYTIDYNIGLYRIKISKKHKDYYFQKLENLIAQFTSDVDAKSRIKSLRQENVHLIELNEKTEIGVCCEYLTTFIYDKIKIKRLRAIDDMINLCSRMSQVNNVFEQNRLIKDEIYYYFNAKYYDKNREEDTLHGVVRASIHMDLQEKMEFNDLINKYIGLVEDPVSGEFISNIKHLRGSTMKLLREDPDSPSLMILKSYALFVLSDKIPLLYNEAVKEFVDGLVSQMETDALLKISRFDSKEFINEFIKRLKNHVSLEKVDNWFPEIISMVYAKYHAKWTSTFAAKFMNGYDDLLDTYKNQ